MIRGAAVIQTGPTQRTDSLLGYAPWNHDGGRRYDRENCACLGLDTSILPALIVAIVTLEAFLLFFFDYGDSRATFAGILSPTVFYLCSIDALKYNRPLPLFVGVATVCLGGAVFGVLAIAQAFIFPWLDKSTVQLIVLLEVLPIVTMWLLFQFYCFRTVFRPVFRIAFYEAYTRGPTSAGHSAPPEGSITMGASAAHL